MILFGIGLVQSVGELTKFTGVELPGLLLFVNMNEYEVFVNMNEQDMNEWTGGCCCGDCYLCYVLFLVVFSY